MIKSTFRPLIVLLALTQIALAQGKYTLFGDVKIDDSKVQGQARLSINLVLYTESGSVIGRQTIMAGSRYRFVGIRSGAYDLVIQIDNNEVARIRTIVGGSIETEYRQDLDLELQSNRAAVRPKPGTISAADLYERAADNQTLFTKARSAMVKQKYGDAAALFKQLLAADPKDFGAWAELGTTFFLQDKFGDAETAYRRALEEKPKFALGLLNLGRVLIAQKKFEEAIRPLTQLIEVRNDSADGNFLIGEAYLQMKKGSSAVPYLKEAARLGQADAHLRLATLYNAAGLKSEAAFEYEEFLKKKPDYPNRKELDRYIAEQKKP
ncbi:MAG TPA: tetratricopeptide repeat protein [Pyrinomonadaceae bacterium]|nr:tetratricopeptide repeat protein [Pyrinomonadaceae bacterium]